MILTNASKRTKWALILVILLLALLAVSGTIWWKRVYTRPDNVFSRMLDNAFTANSVAKHSLTEGEGQKIDQVTDLFLKPEPTVHGLVEISQQGANSNSVKRETITTKTESFVRLVSINTTQKTSDGKDFNFSSVIGVWGRDQADESNNSMSQLFGQSVAVPYVSLSPVQRQQLLKQIQTDGVYEVDYAHTAAVHQNGRTYYQYPVSVKPDAFINMMKTIGTLMGVKGYEQINVSDYKNLPKVKFTFTVDVMSGDLAMVDYGNGQTEDYSGYGLRTAPLAPKDAVTMQELQNRLQSLQK